MTRHNLILTLAALSFLALTAQRSDAALVSHWKLDDALGTTAVDSVSGFDVTGTGTFQTTGVAGTAVSFASGQQLSRAYTAALNPSSFTISFWYKPDTTGRDDPLKNIYGPAPYDVLKGYYFYKDGTTLGVVTGDGNGTPWDNVLNTTSFAGTAGEWYHIVASYDSATTTKRLYVSQLGVGFDPSPASATATVVPNDASPFYVPDTNTGADYDDIQLYNTALNATEVEFLFNNPGLTIPSAPFEITEITLEDDDMITQAEDATADVHVRIGSYNVLFGIWATPQRIGEMFKAHDLDVIGFNEVPNGDWTAKVGQQLGMKHAYVGKLASANHKDKYKSILSRTPLTNMHEIKSNAKRSFKPSSMVGADTIIRGVSVRVYSLHLAGQPKAAGSDAEFIAQEVIPKIDVDRFIILGDFNNHIGDAPFKKLEQAGMRASWKDIGFDVKPESTHTEIIIRTESGVIDHILYNVASGAKAVGGGIIKDAFNPPDEKKSMPNYHAEWEKYGKPLSDHKPIWAELVYPLEK